MRRWFDRLAIHQKLIVMALVVTTSALTVAVSGLIAVDLWRYRSAAVDDAVALARVIAENTTAAVVFGDPDAARQSLSTLRVRPSVRRACLYLPDGTLFAGFDRSPEYSCSIPQVTRQTWSNVSGTATVTSNGRIEGTVYVERALTEIRSRIAVAVVTSLVMLLLAGAVALTIADRLHRTVSVPISQLAAAARAIGSQGPQPSLPQTHTGRDEIADLVRAFSEMLRNVRDANELLRRKEVEREDILAREREASRLKDEFLAAVSHELRTPLNAILGWIQVLSATRPDEQTTAKAIASIARNARAQTRVIEDLVDVSRIVTGKMDLRFEPVDLRDPIEGAVDVIRPTAQAMRIQFDLELPDEQCLVKGDRDRLQQVIWNLLSNAVKFTRPGESIRVVMRGRDSTYEVAVVDTGVGIPAPFLPYVFDRFRQADGSMRREHGGLGLGLAIVKELTELHGGSVNASSAGPGHGATFTVRLPGLVGPEADIVALPEPGPQPASRALAGVRVLAVDDNIDALDIVTATLESAGAAVRTETSGHAALDQLELERPDVLICDLAMPDMDGFDVLERMRERDRTSRPLTPAIAVSAHVSEEYRARSLRAGFFRHLAKPYRAGDLIQAVADALASRTERGHQTGSDGSAQMDWGTNK